MADTRILVIDDENIIARTMKNILQLEGYYVETAINGTEGVQMLKEGNFDIVFLDLKLPDKNGIEVLKEIKEINLEATVIIVTGYATLESATTAIRLSAYDYIFKPIEPEQIRNAVKNALRRKEIEANIRRRIPEPKVMLIENVNNTLKGIREKLTKENIQTLSVHSGKEAIEFLKRDSNINNILYAASNDEINGVEFLEAAKGINPELMFICITSTPNLKEAVEMMKEGAFDYLVKPVKVGDLFELLKKAWLFQNLSLTNKQLIYDLQKINEKISKSEGHLSSILRSIGEAVITSDMQGLVSLMNDAAASLIGISCKEAERQPIENIFKVIDENTLEPLENPIFSLLDEEDSNTIEKDILLVTKNGNHLPIAVSASLIKTTEGAIIGTVLVFRDMTERNRIQKELLSKNRELDDFAFRVSHDIKSPINLIKAYVTAIEENPNLGEQYFSRIKNQTSKALELIDKLLNLSRAGKIIEKKENINLELLSRKIFTVLKSRHQAMELKLDLEEKSIYGDSTGLMQLFSNLFENAIKYKDVNKDKVKISLSAKSDNDNIMISFKDNGIGIEQKFLKRIFVPGFIISKGSGTGFGLTIAKKIVSAHEGEISARSEGINSGVEFIIKLPQRK